MSSDFSRQRFNPANDFSSVLMQQGRVQLDADWNEWNEILDRRWRSETIDIMGRGVVPLETPHGFEILLSGGSLTIGRGRIYVDGLQAENHGAGNLEFDPVLAESRGIDPIPYDKQLYFPNAPALPEAGGPHLVFVDVWEREVTYVEDPDLVENAVGVDTTSRLQTAWQVRVLPNVGDNATCGTPDEQLAGWLDIIRPSAGRLTTKAVGVATPDDPCLIPPSGGYRGLENRLYRVEIHDGGIVGKATFKWSRDNASVATGVNRIEGNLTLTVDRAVWDSVRRFSPGDWVEITDDWQEFSGAPGEIRRIASVVDADRTTTLDTALPNGLFPVDGQNLTAPERHTRIKRWDQTGIVRDSNGNTYVDLDSAGSTGLIKVPDAGTSLILEDGVEVTFTTASNDGVFRSGDYWVFVARTADASVEELNAAPPRGVHHHYCRLALVTFPEQVLDCRTFWPPSFGEAESCDCTICITAEQHNQGTLTIQQAVNQLLKTGGTVCLGPGIFNLMEKPVQLTGAFAVRIRGQGAATILIQPRANPAFIVNQTQWCTIDYLTIHTIAAATIAPAIQLTNSVGATIERLIIAPPAEGNGPLAGISLEAGFLLMTRIRDNFIRAQSGVIFPLKAAGDDSGALLLGSFYCERNTMQCSDTGIRLDGSSFYTSDTVLARNFIFGTTIAGISATGFAFPELEITGNTLTPQKGDGIIVGTGGVRISENRIINLNVDTQNGIRLVHGLVALAVAPIVVKGNRLQGLRGDGLSIETALISAVVQNNVFNAVEGTGLIMQPGSAAGSLKVLANELINIAVASATSDKTTEIAAIYLRGVFEGAVSDNAISAVGINSPIAGVIAGVRIDNSVDVRVSDNSITNIAPASQFSKPAAGILVVGPIANIEIADNLIKRQIQTKDIDDSPWQAIRIAGTIGDTKLNTFIALDTQSSLGKINTVSSLAAASAPGKEQVGIIGNSIHGYGRSALAEVVVSGSCRFSDNYCSEVAESVESAVTLAADSIITSANRVECAHNTKALNLIVPDKNVFTVLGNIVGGPIVVNNAPLPAPWQPLNILAP
jgi:hypothetical protein